MTVSQLTENLSYSEMLKWSKYFEQKNKPEEPPEISPEGLKGMF